MLLSAIRACVGHERQRDNFAIFLRPTEQICPDSAGPFHSFDPVGFAIFATSLRRTDRSSIRSEDAAQERVRYRAMDLAPTIAEQQAGGRNPIIGSQTSPVR